MYVRLVHLSVSAGCLCSWTAWKKSAARRAGVQNSDSAAIYFNWSSTVSQCLLLILSTTSLWTSPWTHNCRSRSDLAAVNTYCDSCGQTQFDRLL